MRQEWFIVACLVLGLVSFSSASICDYDTDPCQNGGLCVGPNCYCPPYFTGTLCETYLTGCDRNVCQNGATCVVDSGGIYHTCNCAQGFTGDRCQHAITPCYPTPCLYGGTCTYVDDQFTCHCYSLYTGTTCETIITPCLSNPCERGVCKELSASYYCSCSGTGYHGTHCEIEDTPCTYNPCWANPDRICVVTGTSYTCACFPEYTGADCDIPVNVALNYISVTQSSNFHYNQPNAHLAVDGDKNTNYVDGSCTHTAGSDTTPYWEVTFPQEYRIGRVVITNRQDCCSERLSNLDIFVGDVFCAHYEGPPPSNQATITMLCPSTLTGDKVRIEKELYNALSMCEVELFIV